VPFSGLIIKRLKLSLKTFVALEFLLSNFRLITSPKVPYFPSKSLVFNKMRKATSLTTSNPYN
jgi:hypothetical protein